MNPAIMREEFLHYVWKMKRFILDNLQTTDGLSIDIIKGGIHNHNSGPDFLEAKIRIGDTIWAGHVEIHKKTSDWLKHKHQLNPAYKNVILHVVYEHDTEIKSSADNVIPTLELGKRINPDLILNYQYIIESKEWIPCQDQLIEIDPDQFKMFLYRLALERLERKSKRIAQCFEALNNDWEECLYHLLMQYFGFKVNENGFVRLAKKTPFALLRKYQDQRLKLAALLFGQSDLLESADDYGMLLLREYNLLQQKHGLQKMEKHEWKFSRLRPPNFPTIRIAQMISLLHTNKFIFQKIIKMNSYKEICDLFNLELDAYWETHYRFGKISKKKIKKLGQKSIDSIILNVIIPILFTYSNYKKDQILKERAMIILDEIPSERNNIIQKWKALGFKPKNGQESQGLIELKKKYCELQKCIECQIGNKILTR